MKNLKVAVGKYGEDIAEEYLKKQGYHILNRNFRSYHGEIDIIARDNLSIAFIEVKTRYNMGYGVPCESVNSYKQLKLCKVAKYYISINKLSDCNFRFDVLEIFLNYNNDHKFFNLFKNAFYFIE
ncbi:YraN family protein [Clostridium cellulovorans]|uniref:UPF0102 protein Clocel_1769 n=1 Tax=Clostridium cellulovorans (strain ATCC 35296 / DSM 3052 / OCM 3 / 743B) TaxID=573061 RepID=D9SKL7_CLOC7|nr:YraN family protein [Clostridium cellulovorans]ADL51513.1 uncharacterized protein family UPF0102 [Clostridium cellulovorans 743B]